MKEYTLKQIEAFNMAVIQLEVYAPIKYKDSHLFDILLDMQQEHNRDRLILEALNQEYLDTYKEIE